MARPCRVCIHPSRSAIETAILNGKPATATASAFDFTYTTGKGAVVGDHKVITNHRDKCMPEAYAASVNERNDATATLVGSRLKYLDDQVDHVITEARKGTPIMVGEEPFLDAQGRQRYEYDHHLLLAAVRAGRANIELAAKLAGQVPDGKPEELEAQRRLLESPKARALLADLAALDAQHDAADARSD